MLFKVCHRFDIHTGVGFCVARSTGLGNAKAFRCGTSDGMDSHVFLHFLTYNQTENRKWGAADENDAGHETDSISFKKHSEMTIRIASHDDAV